MLKVNVILQTQPWNNLKKQERIMLEILGLFFDLTFRICLQNDIIWTMFISRPLQLNWFRHIDLNIFCYRFGNAVESTQMHRICDYLKY